MVMAARQLAKLNQVTNAQEVRVLLWMFASLLFQLEPLQNVKLLPPSLTIHAPQQQQSHLAA